MLMDISFTCQCGEHREETVHVSEPNFMAEKSKDSASESYEEISCSSCGADHEITVINTFGGADCYIDDGDTDVNFGMPYYPLCQDSCNEDLIEFS